MCFGLSEGEERWLSQRTLQPGAEERRLPQVSPEAAPQLHSLLESCSQSTHLQRPREDEVLSSLPFTLEMSNSSLQFSSLPQKEDGAAFVSVVSRRGLHLAEVLTNLTDGLGLSGEGQVTGMMLRLSGGPLQRSHSGADLPRSHRHFLEERKAKTLR